MQHTIIFDVDGTLLNTEVIYMAAWVEASKLHGYVMPDEALRKTRAVNAKHAAEVFRSYCGEDFSYETVRVDRVRIAEERIAAMKPEQLCMPQARETLAWLCREGYTLAAASSTGYEKTVEHLRHGGLLEFFQVIIGGDMVEKGKPNPDIFLKAAREAGAEPGECLVVGDTPADILAAHAAGIRSVMIPDQVQPNEQIGQMCWKVLENLASLQATELF